MKIFLNTYLILNKIVGKSSKTKFKKLFSKRGSALLIKNLSMTKMISPQSKGKSLFSTGAHQFVQDHLIPHLEILVWNSTQVQEIKPKFKMWGNQFINLASSQLFTKYQAFKKKLFLSQESSIRGIFSTSILGRNLNRTRLMGQSVSKTITSEVLSQTRFKTSLKVSIQLIIKMLNRNMLWQFKDAKQRIQRRIT